MAPRPKLGSICRVEWTCSKLTRRIPIASPLRRVCRLAWSGPRLSCNARAESRAQGAPTAGSGRTLRDPEQHNRTDYRASHQRERLPAGGYCPVRPSMRSRRRSA
jgi:hypothetical protein